MFLVRCLSQARQGRGTEFEVAFAMSGDVVAERGYARHLLLLSWCGFFALPVVVGRSPVRVRSEVVILLRTGMALRQNVDISTTTFSTSA